MALKVIQDTDTELDEFMMYRDEIDGITSEHYSIFLKYLLINKSIVEAPDKVKRLSMSMESDLNALGTPKLNSEWVAILKKWKNKVLKEYEKNNDKKFTTEQLELINVFQKYDTSYIPEDQLSCILDHVEVAHESPKLWETISVEMLSFNIDESDTHWKMLFQRWCQHVAKRKEMLNKWDGNETNRKRPKILSSNEIRTVEIMTYYNIENYKPVVQPKYFEKVCRVCLVSSKDNMLELFNKHKGPIHYVNKINMCATITPIKIDDGFPQCICIKCKDLIETAFKFKILCEKSDFLMRRNLENKKTLENAEENQIKDDCIVKKSENICLIDDLVDESEDENFLDDQEEDQEVVAISDNENTYPENMEFEFIDDINDESEKDESPDSSNEETESDNRVKSSLIDIEILDFFDENDAVDMEMESNVTVDDGKISSQLSYDCQKCGRNFRTLRNLRLHKRIHIPPRKELTCKDCGKLSYSIRELEVHSKIHTGELEFVCEICGRRYFSKSGLRHHREGHLSSGPTYQCTMCVYKTRIQNDLKTHLRVHTGEKPFVCNICSKQFSTSSNLYKHRLTHSDNSYECQLCSSVLKNLTSYNDHLKRHRGIVDPPVFCKICPNIYKYPRGLRRHMKKHHAGVEVPTEESI